MRRLPVLVERSITEASTMRSGLASDFEQGLRADPDVGQVSCKKGCNNCCYHPVYLSLLEGISLFRYLYSHKQWNSALEAELEIVHHRTRDLSIEIWALSAQPCPLLKDSQCSVYEGRPLPCRVTFSIGDPHDCHPHRLSKPNVLLPRKEVFEVAAQLERESLKRHGLKFFRFPLATALLMGAKVAMGKIEFERAYRALLDMGVKDEAV